MKGAGYIIAALACICIVLGSGWYSEHAGRAADAAAHDAAIAKSNAAALERAAERDAAAAEVVRLARIAGDRQLTSTINEGNARAERVRTITRVVEVPAGCPVHLPDGVRAEIDAAVSAAIAAGRRLRAGPGAGDTGSAAGLDARGPGLGRADAGRADG